ncbi:DUF2087 domain-containing protein [Vagococcus acidifermentans]|uniref:DUF2087 domain-containing protein n=1 Tax=Vagococcus acidifermentans TaxID=564710 RepID=A0A430AVJ0_9ENTE|nr:DUF2087 domain-containing protein [Vagococcus acidifermentans]RSU12078.1 hypothetical protein CBF27_06540 [Vagococcus acidifermentans]
MDGYQKEGNMFVCDFCQQTYEDGLIYTVGEHLADASYAMRQHILQVHGGVLQALIQLDRHETGLSEVQQQLLSYFAGHLKDDEIAERMGIRPVTVRNHRFKLREKKRQAEKFLAIMTLLEKNIDEGEVPMIIHDERFDISEEERQKVLANFLDEKGLAKQIPKKEKRKIILLQELIKRFDRQRNYTEKEVNQVITTMFSDYVSIRRYLVDYGLLARTLDGAVYWVV